MTRILAIDPGSEQSAWLRLVLGTPMNFGIEPNEGLIDRLRRAGDLAVDVTVIEWMSPRGMPTSAQEFETMWWAGRFAEAVHPGAVVRLKRSAVKGHLCGNQKANDANIRAALIDRFGGIGGKAAAVGLKASPGPLYGVANDLWQALAVAVTYADDPEKATP